MGLSPQYNLKLWMKIELQSKSFRNHDKNTSGKLFDTRHEAAVSSLWFLEIFSRRDSPVVVQHSFIKIEWKDDFVLWKVVHRTVIVTLTPAKNQDWLPCSFRTSVFLCFRHYAHNLKVAIAKKSPCVQIN